MQSAMFKQHMDDGTAELGIIHVLGFGGKREADNCQQNP